MGQGVGGERQTRQVRQASASCGAVGQGVGGERQARQVRQASAGCGAVGQGSGGEGPVRQARQVRQASCGAEGFCLNVSLVSLVSGGPLKVRRACLTCLAQVFWKVRGAGTRQPAELVSLVSMSQGVSLGFGGRGDCQPAEGVSVSRLSRGGSSRGPTCRRSQLSRLSRGGVLWGSGGVRQPAELVSLVSMSQAGPLGFGGRGDCQPAEGVSDVSLVSRGGPLGFGGRRPTARRACLTCLAGRPPGSAELVSVVSLVSGASVLWAGDWRGVSHRSVGNFFRDFSMFCWLDFA